MKVDPRPTQITWHDHYISGLWSQLYKLIANSYFFCPIVDCNLRHTAAAVAAAATEAASVAKLLDVHQRRNFSCHRAAAAAPSAAAAELCTTMAHKASSIFLITGRAGASIVCHQKRLGL